MFHEPGGLLGQLLCESCVNENGWCHFLFLNISTNSDILCFVAGAVRLHDHNNDSSRNGPPVVHWQWYIDR